VQFDQPAERRCLAVLRTSQDVGFVLQVRVHDTDDSPVMPKRFMLVQAIATRFL
jgi:hypothetical protein